MQNFKMIDYVVFEICLTKVSISHFRSRPRPTSNQQTENIHILFKKANQWAMQVVLIENLIEL
jgi:hypothetical protein